MTSLDAAKNSKTSLMHENYFDLDVNATEALRLHNVPQTYKEFEAGLKNYKFSGQL